MIEILTVEGRRALREFLSFPYRLYRGDPYWVPPLRLQQKQLLDRKRHPFYAGAEAQFFLARRNGETAGRIAAILDRRYIEYHGEQAGSFGFFECVDDGKAAGALLSTAAEWLRERGTRVMRGPMNPSTNYDCGLLVEGFDSSPRIMMPYNPPYYAELFKRAGLKKAKDLYAYTSSTREVVRERVFRIAERSAAASGIRIRPVRLNDFDTELELFWNVYNSAWSRNWGFVPMTRDELIFMAREMKPIVDPNLVLLGEVKNRVVACALALPDINEALKHARGRLFPLGLLKILYHKRFIRNVRVLILGVVEEYRTAGVPAGMYSALIRNASQGDYQEAELSWVLEDNVLMNRSMEALGAKRYKTYRIYEWN